MIIDALSITNDFLHEKIAKPKCAIPLQLIMKLHREAFPTLFFACMIFVLFNVAMWRMFDDYPMIHRILFYITMGLLGLVFYFFRVPFEVPEVSNDVVISPAHGKVVEIVEEQESKFFKDKRLRISIFMSPLNIHCNYVPFAGKVLFADHFPGKYLVAFHPKSSELNEHTFSVIEGEKMTVGVKQIAGFMARRIVPYLQKGQAVQQNDELGFIKFGSRVDVFFPVGTELQVKVGDRTKGGQTILANLA